MKITKIVWLHYALVVVAGLLTSAIMSLLYFWLDLKVLWVVAFWLIALFAYGYPAKRQLGREMCIASLFGLLGALAFVRYVMGA